MSVRDPDHIDEDMLEAIHTAAISLIQGANNFRAIGQPEKADRFRRIGQMLKAVALGVRDPLLVAIWAHSGRTNHRVSWSSEIGRREWAVGATYLLLKCDDGMEKRASKAARQVATRTGVPLETIRANFKGRSIPDFERSGKGREIRELIDNVVEFSGLSPDAPWDELYELFIACAVHLSEELETDSARVRQIGLKGGD